MSFLVPKAPKMEPIAAPATPSMTDDETQLAARKERDKYYASFGGRGTAMLAGGGGSGLGANPGFGAAARLLGGGGAL